MKLAVITPVSHLEGIRELLESKEYEIFYLEAGNKFEVRDLLLKENIDVILCNPNKQSYVIDKDLLEGTNVSLINTCSTGMNHIDLEYCKYKKIKILSLTKDYELINNLPSTAELAFGLMCSLLRKIPEAKDHTSIYGWDYTQFVGRQIKDLKIGIIGYGRLGKMMAKYCEAFGARILIYDPYIPIYSKIIQTNPLEQLFKECDVISLHVHITNETKYMVNKRLLDNMKEESYIINTSRGEIVNEKDIVDSLKNGPLKGYGTDVVEDEFGDLKKSPIIKAMNKGENIIVTPHIGGMTIEGQTKAYTWAINKL